MRVRAFFVDGRGNDAENAVAAGGVLAAASRPCNPTYVQGCNFLAGMCLGYSGGREEIGFWLFLHLVEGVLGHEYFSKTWPLLGYHADRAVAVDT